MYILFNCLNSRRGQSSGQAPTVILWFWNFSLNHKINRQEASTFLKFSTVPSRPTASASCRVWFSGAKMFNSTGEHVLFASFCFQNYLLTALKSRPLLTITWIEIVVKTILAMATILVMLCIYSLVLTWSNNPHQTSLTYKFCECLTINTAYVICCIEVGLEQKTNMSKRVFFPETHVCILSAIKMENRLCETDLHIWQGHVHPYHPRVCATLHM